MMSIKVQNVKMWISLCETHIARERLVGQSVELSKLLHKEAAQSAESRRHQFLSPEPACNVHSYGSCPLKYKPFACSSMTIVFVF